MSIDILFKKLIDKYYIFKSIEYNLHFYLMNKE